MNHGSRWFFLKSYYQLTIYLYLVLCVKTKFQVNQVSKAAVPALIGCIK